MLSVKEEFVMRQLNVEVFADGADIEEMKAAYKNKQVDGFTTNPV